MLYRMVYIIRVLQVPITVQFTWQAERARKTSISRKRRQMVIYNNCLSMVQKMSANIKKVWKQLRNMIPGPGQTQRELNGGAQHK